MLTSLTKCILKSSKLSVHESYQVVQLRIGRKNGLLRANLQHTFRISEQNAEKNNNKKSFAVPLFPGRCSPTCLAKAAMSSLKDSEEQTSLWLAMPGRWEVAEREEEESRGEQVASSHFSNTKASSGKSG